MLKFDRNFFQALCYFSNLVDRTTGILPAGLHRNGAR